MHLSQQIVASARSWRGTRFTHQGRLKATDTHKGGVDCLGLLVGVADELGLEKAGKRLSSLDETDYSHFPDGKRLYGKLCEVMRRVDKVNIQPGDVVLLEIKGSPQHLAIISDYPDGLGMIHAYAASRKVVEHRLDDGWREKISTAFRFQF
jgi:cell wall-associated NlpC family hydrolase